MSTRAQVAVACAQPDEQTAVARWLDELGYDPVTVADLARIESVLQTHRVEAVVADLALLPRTDDIWGLMRRLGVNRPLVVLGSRSRLPTPLASDASVIERPLTREQVLVAVGLALAEGRPVRQHGRRQIGPVRGTAHGFSVIVREASVGGVGLELIGPRTTVLPPTFRLRVPDAGVHVQVKRAWMTAVSPTVMRCGGAVEGDLPDARQPWAVFARETPPASLRRVSI